MKHIKKFENNKKFSLGDIVYYNINNEELKEYFDKNPGEIVNYNFTKHGDYYVLYFYNLIPGLDYNNDKELHIKMDQSFRKATTEETKEYNIKKEANKYNL